MTEANDIAVTESFIRAVFKGLEGGSGEAFFVHVADYVDWTVMGTHPLAGRYRTKQAFRQAIFARLNEVLPGGAKLQVEHVFVAGNDAVVELRSGAVAKNGMRFDNRYCWVMKFEAGLITQVRAYLDSAMVARVLAENEQ